MDTSALDATAAVAAAAATAATRETAASSAQAALAAASADFTDVRARVAAGDTTVTGADLARTKDALELANTRLPLVRAAALAAVADHADARAHALADYWATRSAALLDQLATATTEAKAALAALVGIVKAVDAEFLDLRRTVGQYGDMNAGGRIRRQPMSIDFHPIDMEMLPSRFVSALSQAVLRSGVAFEPPVSGPVWARRLNQAISS